MSWIHSSDSGELLGHGDTIVSYGIVCLLPLGFWNAGMNRATIRSEISRIGQISALTYTLCTIRLSGFTELYYFHCFLGYIGFNRIEVRDRSLFNGTSMSRMPPPAPRSPSRFSSLRSASQTATENSTSSLSDNADLIGPLSKWQVNQADWTGFHTAWILRGYYTAETVACKWVIWQPCKVTPWNWWHKLGCHTFSYGYMEFLDNLTASGRAPPWLFFRHNPRRGAILWEFSQPVCRGSTDATEQWSKRFARSHLDWILRWHAACQNPL